MARKYELINDLYDQIIVDVTKELERGNRS